MSKLLSVFLVVSFFAGASVALADDSNPPWWRGQWSTTTQWWEFRTPDDGSADNDSDGLPDGLTPDGPGPLQEGSTGDPYDPGYLPSTRLWVNPLGDWISQDQISLREGIWPLSGYIDVVVDNHEPTNPKKIVWVQLTWRPQPGSTGEAIIDPWPPLAGFTSTAPIIEDETTTGDGWLTTTYSWEIYPNPVDEWFTIYGDIEVDQLVIDTWCIPEPATLGMLLMGGLVLLRRRK